MDREEVKEGLYTYLHIYMEREYLASPGNKLGTTIHTQIITHISKLLIIDNYSKYTTLVPF